MTNFTHEKIERYKSIARELERLAQNGLNESKPECEAIRFRGWVLETNPALSALESNEQDEISGQLLGYVHDIYLGQGDKVLPFIRDLYRQLEEMGKY